MSANKKTKYPFFKQFVKTPSLPFLLDMVSVAKREIIIISPWIRYSTLKKFVGATNQDTNLRWKVLSRGNSKDFYDGVSDINAFKFMIEEDSFELKSIKNLHAKVYIVDDTISLVTSANLTVSGMEINPEIGVASLERDKITQLMSEINEWFDQAKSLDKEWLKIEQQKLLEFQKSRANENFPHLKQNDTKSSGGKYRKLSLPGNWKPLLNSLRETAIAIDFDYLMVDGLVEAFVVFFAYLGTIDKGERIQKNLVDWLVHKQPLEAISGDKTRENISRKIGNRKDKSENIWNSKEGRKLKRQVLLFLNKAVERTEIRTSDVLSTEQLHPLGLSHFDLYQFLCGMIENKIINAGNSHAEITPTNHFLIYDKETYSILKKLDRIYHNDFQNFISLEKFCLLGELERVENIWFHPKLGIFENLYLTENRKIACQNWSVVQAVEAVALELGNNLECYYWHYSEICEALRYLFPVAFEKTGIRYVRERLSENSPEIFQYAGCKGTWQLTYFGDGSPDNKDAIISILREASTPIATKEVIKKLEENRRCFNENSIGVLLSREKDVFEYLKDQGKFRLRESIK